MPTYEVRVKSSFEAAHHLTSYHGEPEPVHGHSFRVEVTVRTAALDDEGMAFDFIELKSCLDELASRFHRRHINTVPPFDERTPTSEHLAAWFFAALRERVPEAPLYAVTIWEAPDCSATYREEDA